MPQQVRTGKILILDSDNKFSGALADGLSRLGYDYFVSPGGEQGLREFTQNDYSLVISELGDVHSNGNNLLKKVRNQRRKTPVIIASSQGTIGNAVKAIQDGVFDFIPPAISPEELDVVVRRALDHGELQTRLARMQKLTYILAACIPVWIALGFLVFKFWLS